MRGADVADAAEHVDRIAGPEVAMMGSAILGDSTILPDSGRRSTCFIAEATLRALGAGSLRWASLSSWPVEYELETASSRVSPTPADTSVLH